MIVVKLGGSLYDHPALRVGLNRWLDAIPSRVLLVPGGGDLAEAVRDFDRLHGLGERTSHHCAIHSMVIAGIMLRTIVASPRTGHVSPSMINRVEGRLPKTWGVTSDSIALFLANMKAAGKLILLKSMDRPAGTWEELAERGFVDRHFPELARLSDVPIEVVNFRRYLDGYMNVEST